MDMLALTEPVSRAKISVTTQQKLGQSGINMLLRNLWAVDCQTCGETLGGGRPSLVVTEWPGWHEASLHHQDCRTAEWNDTHLILDFVDTSSYVSWALTLSHAATPIVVINPSMERVAFTSSGDGWKLLYEGHDYGFAPLADTDAWDNRDINRDTLVVMERCQTHGQHATIALGGEPRWKIDCPSVVADDVHAVGGIHVLITHSVNPALWSEGGTYNKQTLLDLIDSGDGEAVFCGLAKVTLEPLAQEE